MENFVALADDTLLTILQNFSPHQILQTIQPSCKRLIYLCYRLDQVPIYAACPSYLNPSNNQPGRYLYASQVAQVLSAQLSAQEDIKSSIEISDLVSYLPNAYHSRKPLWFFFILRVGEIVFDQKLTSFESLSLTSTAESLFSRTFNAIRKLRRFRQEQLIAKKINRKGNAGLILQTHTNPDPLTSPFILAPEAMPVEIAPLHELQPFFDLLREGKGINQQFLSAQKRSCIEKDRDQLAKEFISMPKGTLFADGRMDMCKQVVGSQNLQALCEALAQSRLPNFTPLVKHFLLGNNLACQNDPLAAIHLANLIRKNLPVETFYLAGNCLNHDSIKLVAEALQCNTQVKALWLKRNPVGSEGAKALGHCLAGPDCPLRLLDLNNCGLGNQGLDAFCHAVELTGTEILALRYVYLDANAIAGGSPAFSRLCQLLKGPLRGMRTFYLSINSLGDHGVMELVKVLPDMKNLRYLSLASNQITDRVMPELLKSFPNSLKGLDLGYYKSTKDLGGLPNQITEQSLPLFEQWICEKPNIEYLDLRNNNFQNDGQLIAFVERIAENSGKGTGRMFSMDARQLHFKGIADRLMIRGHGHGELSLRFVKHSKRVLHIDSVYRNKVK